MNLFKLKRWSTYLCLSIMLQFIILSMFSSPSSVKAANNELQLEAGSAILIEASTGQVLYKNNENEALPPASMSKMMSEYLVLEAVNSGAISWDDVVTTSENAAATIGSRIFLAQGDRHTVEELYIAMAIYSANDATIALAEFIAGSEEAFAKRMNEKAREFGLSSQAHFINATGLDRDDMPEKFQPTSIQGETLLSAKDAALIALNIIQNYPEALEYSSIPTHQFRERDSSPMINLNRMLEAWADMNNLFSPMAYEGLDGFKTGHTSAAGYCFTGTAERDGMRLISVVMNTDSENSRFVQTQKLLDYGFNNFEKRTVLAAKSEFEQLPSVPITKGLEDEVTLLTDSGIELMMRIDDTEESYSWEVTSVSEDQLVAPIAKGDVLGQVVFTYNGAEKIERTIHLIAADDVDKAGWFRLLFRSIGSFFSNIFDSIKGIFG